MKIRDKVLIVEDEQNIKNFMSTILAANGFDTLMAGGAKEALSMISSHCPDLIILDLGLPDMDGMEVLKQVRAWSAIRHTRTGLDNDSIAQSGKYTVRDLTIDYDKHHVLMRGEDVHLTLNEFKIVALLGKYAGKVLTYDFLIREIWGPKAKADNQILRVNMANIRRKIEKNPAAPEYIFTEIGVGYRMLENE